MPHNVEPSSRRDPKVVAWFVRMLEWAVMTLMGMIALLVIVEVGLRWLAGGASLIVHEELTRYLMVWTVMLGAALLVHEDGHIRISILTDTLPRPLALLCYFLAQLAVLTFLGVLVVTSVINIPDVIGQQTITLGVSMAWFFAALPVGGALMFLLVVYNTVQTARGLRSA
ncbi:MAG: TRAP transporter small permease [bacterium]